MTNVLLLSYLDPGAGNASPFQWVLLAAIVVVLLLAVVYGLTRFVKWAAQR